MLRGILVVVICAACAAQVAGQRLVEPARFLAVPALDLVAGAGGGSQLRIDHDPGTAVFPFIAERTSATALGGGYGVALIDLSLALPLPPITLNNQGTAALSIQPLALPPGTIVYAQAALLEPGGTARLSNRVALFEPFRRAPFGNELRTEPFARSPRGVAIGDLDGDGDLDMAVANTGDYSVYSYTNRGSGAYGSEFDPGPTVLSGDWFQSVVLADFNGDGRLDMAGTDGLQSALEYALKSPGSGWDRSTTMFLAPGAQDLAAGDFDLDGNTDLVVTHPGSGSLSILWGSSVGAFSMGPTLVVGGGPTEVVVGDLNVDGFQDIVYVDPGLSSVSVILSRFGRTFDPPINLPNAGTPRACAVGYLDADLALDVVVVGDGGVRVLLGQNNGSFIGGGFYATSEAFRCVALADLNSDGALDVVAGGDGMIDTFPGDGVGGLVEPAATRLLAGGSFFDLSLGDLTGDGVTDLVAANSLANGVSIFPGRPGETFASVVPQGYPGTDVASGDFNNDGLLDLVTRNPDSLLLGQFSGGFSPPQSLPLTVTTISDIDGDGNLDLAGVSGMSVQILLGNGSGFFSGMPTVSSTSQPAWCVAFGDLNGDSVPDMVVGDRVQIGRSSVSVHLGLGGGSFTAGVSIPNLLLGRQMNDVLVHDWTGDGRNDVIAIGHDSSMVVVPNSPTGVFDPPSSYFVGASPFDMKLADLRGDGEPEILVADFGVRGSGTDHAWVYVVEKTPSGVVSTRLRAGIWPTRVDAADLNADGFMDIVVFNSGTAEVGVFMGTSSGDFEDMRSHTLPRGSQGFALADFDGNGFADALFGSTAGLGLLLNETVR